jgi:hypothetical protein
MKKQSSLDISESSGLCLDNAQDALDHASHLVKSCNDWLASHNLNFVERYDKMEIDVIVSVGTSLSKYSFIFNAIPCWQRNDIVAGDLFLRNLNRTLEKTDRNEDLMLISVAYPVESPQKIIPSFVWLERSKERLNIISEICKEAIPLKLRGIVSERKFSSSRLHDVRNTKSGVDSLVKSRPEIEDGISTVTLLNLTSDITTVAVKRLIILKEPKYC